MVCRKGLFVILIFIFSLFPCFSANASDLQDLFRKYPIEQQEIVVDKQTKEVEVNGQESSLAAELDIPVATEKSALNNTKQLDIVMQNSGYEKDSESSKEVVFGSKYRAKRLIVRGNISISQRYNAVEVVTASDYTVLQYEDMDSTEYAYRQLLSDGVDVIIDRVITEDDMAKVLDSGYMDSGVSLMGLDKMQEDKYFQKNEVLVAVFDSGINSQYLSSNRIVDNVKIAGATSEYATIHGSEVTGIILDGTSDNVKVLSVNIYDSSGNASYLTVISAFEYIFTRNDIDIINMSIALKNGEDVTDIDVWNTYIDQAITKNIPVVVAAGNDETSTNYAYPACYEPVWTIGSITKSKTRSYFSNYGNIDLCATGSNIQTVATGDGQGTSFATPYITAFASLLKGGNQYLSVEALYSDILLYCEDLGLSGRDVYYGDGYPVYSEVICKDSHVWDTGTITQSQSCTMCELTLFSCTKCGATKTEQTKTASSHLYKEVTRQDSSCVAKGFVDYKCISCGVGITKTLSIDANAHSYVFKHEDSTYTEQGYDEYTCSLCGYTKKELLPFKEEPIYNVVYHLNGGKNHSLNPSSFKASEQYVLRYPSRKGYTFSGWYADASFTHLVTSLSEEKNHVLYAKWSKVSVKKASITKVSNVRRYKTKITVKKIAGVSGYQIQLCTSKKFKKSVKTYTVSKNIKTSGKLKRGCTYYVRARAYKKDSTNSKVYGKWSKTKKVKIKK